MREYAERERNEFEYQKQVQSYNKNKAICIASHLTYTNMIPVLATIGILAMLFGVDITNSDKLPNIHDG